MESFSWRQFSLARLIPRHRICLTLAAVLAILAIASISVIGDGWQQCSTVLPVQFHSLLVVSCLSMLVSASSVWAIRKGGKISRLTKVTALSGLLLLVGACFTFQAFKPDEERLRLNAQDVWDSWSVQQKSDYDYDVERYITHVEHALRTLAIVFAIQLAVLAFFVSTHYYLRRDLARQRERQQASRELDADYRERRQARDKAALLAQHKPSFGPPPKSALRKSGRAGSSYAATEETDPSQLGLEHRISMSSLTGLQGPASATSPRSPVEGTASSRRVVFIGLDDKPPAADLNADKSKDQNGFSALPVADSSAAVSQYQRNEQLNLSKRLSVLQLEQQKAAKKASKKRKSKKSKERSSSKSSASVPAGPAGAVAAPSPAGAAAAVSAHHTSFAAVGSSVVTSTVSQAEIWSEQDAAALAVATGTASPAPPAASAQVMTDHSLPSDGTSSSAAQPPVKPQPPSGPASGHARPSRLVFAQQQQGPAAQSASAQYTQPRPPPPRTLPSLAVHGGAAAGPASARLSPSNANVAVFAGPNGTSSFQLPPDSPPV